jgi:hypothetical protein
MKTKIAVGVLLAIATFGCLRVAPPETPNQRAVRREMERRDDRKPHSAEVVGTPVTPSIAR